MKISVILINYKTPKLLVRCIESIRTTHPEIDDIIVVDNNSQDESVETIQSRYPDIKIIASPTNPGFATAANWGMNYGKYDTFLILNPDISVENRSIEKLYQALWSDASIGLVAPKLLNPDRSLQYSCLEFQKFMTPIYRRTRLGEREVGKRELERFQMKQWDHNDQREVGWAIGAALMIKKEVVDKIGPMDERFFLYYEDMDYCRRVWEAGYKVVYVADAVMLHEHQRLSALHTGFRSFFSNKMTRIHIKSWLKYLWKYRGQLTVQSPQKKHV